MKIALCLSGGGFRAMLFHLGVIRRLAHDGKLANVERIDSVSGGSILAAHLALNWPAYCEDATTASDELVRLAERDVRGRIVRRRLLWILCGMPVVRRGLKYVVPALARRLRHRVTDLLEAEYTRLYRGASLQTLCASGDRRPEIYLHTTSLAAGRPCAFAVRASRTGTREARFLIRTDKGEEAYSADGVHIARAVAASSAFPPMFQPVEVSGSAIGDPALSTTHPLTDGGVFDNLGMHWQLSERPNVNCTLISDADGGLVPNYSSGFRSILTRNLRSNDILMSRNADLIRRESGLELHDAQRALHEFGSRAYRIPIAPTDPLKYDELGGRQMQDALRDIRTDLDRFSEIEIRHLLAHGWAVADAVLREAGIVRAPGPVGPPHIPPQTDLAILKSSSGRRLRLWAPSDPVGMLYLVVLLGWLVLGWVTVQRAWNAPAVRLTDSVWSTASKVWFNEPSGLAATGVTRQGEPLLLGVDDEESALFVLQNLPGQHPGIVGVAAIEPSALDLEGVAFDACADPPEGAVVTSHRLTGAKGRSVNRLTFFTLVEGWKHGAKPLARFEQPVSLHDDIDEILKRAGVVVDPAAWANEAEEPKTPDGQPAPRGYQPYAVEIEGLAYAGGTLTIGMRWPLAGNKAIIWDYKKGEGAIGEPTLLDLGGSGVSALTWAGTSLYIAANPPERELKGTRSGPPLGMFSVYRRTPDGVVGRLDGLDRTLGSIDDAKLEGLAVVGNTLMGAFDGPGHSVRPLGLVAPADQIQSSWLSRASAWWWNRTPKRCH